MAKPELSEEEYIAECNRRLQQHGDYAQGMAFMAYPEGATGGNITGMAQIGFWGKAYMDVANSMTQEFDIKLSPRVGFQRTVSMYSPSR